VEIKISPDDERRKPKTSPKRYKKGKRIRIL
jgi:hypothetical protein